MEATRLEARVGIALAAHGWVCCTAESCTGGLVAHRLTNIAGSSAWLVGGAVTYSNAIKMKLLGVQAATLAAWGAVSEQTAVEMARGALVLFEADFAVSITGIAGPGGGSAEKPVGLTYIAAAYAPGAHATHGDDAAVQVLCRRYVWQGDREANKAASADAALALLLELIGATGGQGAPG